MNHKKYNFLIFGGKGWIGQQFIKYLTSNIIYNLSEFHIDENISISKLRDNIKSYNPTHIISFIGRTHGKINENTYINTIDYLEHKGKLVENIQDNLYAPVLLAMISKELNIHFTYLGTGCIFNNNDNENKNFSENDYPNFFGSSYSIVKGFTDCFMKYFENDILNVRIRMPITDIPNSRNFITKILSYEKICSIPNSMSVLSELLPYLIEFIKDKKVGTINLTNPGTISHNEILEIYKQIIDPLYEWKNFSLEEQSELLLSARSNNSLNTNKLIEWCPNVLSIKDSVYKCMNEYKKYQQTILVTGGCGFIGSNFINHLLNKYTYLKIINIDAMYYCASENNIKEKHRNSKNYILIKESICNADIISDILNKYNINIVIHFAAQSHVQHSFTNPLLYTNDNIVGTHILLEECRKYNKLERFIHISTDEVYGESLLNDNPKIEQSILCPTNPYAATKASAELIAKSYYYSFQLPLIITRSSNIYGINQYPEKVIPTFIKQIRNNEKLTIQGDGSALRAFIYEKDIVNAIELILFKGEIGEIYNIGSDEEYSVLDIAKIIISLKYSNNIKDINEYIDFIEDRPFNDKRYYITNKKIKELGWIPNYTFKEGLKEIWDDLEKN